MAVVPLELGSYFIEQISLSLRLVSISAGLILLLFGGFLVRSALSVLSCTIVIHAVSALTASLNMSPVMTAVAILLAVTATLAAVLHACQYGPSFATGAILGICVALTLHPLSAAAMLLAASSLPAAFGLVFSIAPKEAAIFVTSYGGGFMIFAGMQAIDTRDFRHVVVVPDLVELGNADVWFSLFSFLVVGLLGSGVQLILLTNLIDRALSRSHYDPIP